MTYIALLRAINVGGHTVKMDRLRELFSALGYENVRTYIQSGNVFFDTDEPNRQALRRQIEQYLASELGYEVPTVIRTIEELEETLEQAPFKHRPPAEDERHLVVFTNQMLELPDVPIASPKGDSEVLGTHGADAYVRWKIIGGRPPSDAKFLAATLGGPGTARFYHTLLKLLDAAKSA